MNVAKNYSTSTPVLGGEIKRRIGDFRVREICEDGTVCELKAFTDKEKIKLDKLWPEECKKDNTVILEMEKFNIDVNNAVRKIARALQFSKKRVGFAGMKDKRAITCQRISVWQPDLEKLREFDSRYLDLRFVGFGERIKIGGLKGNEFEITIRNIDKGEDEVREIVEGCFKEIENGVANYFGEQRFGGARNVSHLVGKEFVNGNFEEAVMLYLTSTFPAEEEDVKLARTELAKTKDFREAVKKFPKKFRYERAILHHLCKYPKDYVNAFRKLPRSLIYLFTHAYQSYLFNKYIDKRIESGLGLREVKGDVVKNRQVQGPLFGYELEFAREKPGELEREVLGGEGISLQDFKIKELPELSSKGTRKSIILVPENLRLINVDGDDFNTGKTKATVAFRLDKGNYATTVLREIMKKEG